MYSKPRKKRKPALTLPGTVEKIIPPFASYRPEKAQITIEGADDLYREIRINNDLKDEEGKQAKLKPGDEVDVTIEADGGVPTSKPSEDRIEDKE